MQITGNLKKIRNYRNKIRELMQREQPKKIAGDLITSYNLLNSKVQELIAAGGADDDSITVTFQFEKLDAHLLGKKIVLEDYRPISNLINWID